MESEGFVMSSRHAYGYSLAMSLFFASVAFAGPEHIEAMHGDAGSFATTAQKVYKSYLDPGLDLIMGRLGVTTGGETPDLEDMYLIKIIDPEEFAASTDPAFCVNVGDPPTEVCGSSDFDSQLWLLRITREEDGFALLANDEKASMSGTSKLTNAATDGTSQTIPEAGDYLLAITAYGNVPGARGNELFDLVSRTEVSGPDGRGGESEHTTWTGGGPSVPGDYTIVLKGAGGFPIRVGAMVPKTPQSNWKPAGALTLLLSGLALSGLFLVRHRTRVQKERSVQS